jgi:hypothetical protein
MPKYITWDDVIDVFLSKQYQSIGNNKNSKYNDRNDEILADHLQDYSL